MKMSFIYMLSYEKMSTKTRFEEEAKGNSEMAFISTSLPCLDVWISDLKCEFSFSFD